MFAVGTVLVGKYRVDRVIGQGGMGVVVGATHLHLHQPVALKFLLPDLVHNAQLVERFVREARASAQLRGEHVCRVSDVGAFDNGAPYIVMELLDGSDLSSLLQARGPLPVQQAADFVLQACVGIAEAHALGIVHRDLKPANLFLTRRPDGSPLIKVLDFGIAKAQGDHNFSLTQTSAVLGSPGYMSPEQLRSTRDVDARSDIWSIGVILYELVSGRPPFSGDSITELALRIAMDPTPPLIGRMPQGFDLVVNRCLAKDAAQRYPDLANLAHALAAYGGASAWDMANAVSRLLNVAPPRPGLASQPTIRASTPAMQPAAAAVSPTTMGSAASSMVTTPSTARRWGVITGVVAAAIAVVVVLVVIQRGRQTSSTVPSADVVTAPPAAAPDNLAAVPPTSPTTPSTSPTTPSTSPTTPSTSPTTSPTSPPTSPTSPTSPPSTPSAAPSTEPAVPSTVPVDAGVDAAPKPRPRPPRPRPDTKPEDLGESRY